MTATLDWLGCATFRLTIGNLVVFLDAYIDRVPSAALIRAALTRWAPKTELVEMGYLQAYPIFTGR
jgi:L-ascorbate metabolism protein UlaG (beta-lactamase superfamily)